MNERIEIKFTDVVVEKNYGFYDIYFVSHEDEYTSPTIAKFLMKSDALIYAKLQFETYDLDVISVYEDDHSEVKGYSTNDEIDFLILLEQKRESA
jgi:hypothetical protein